MSDSTRYAVIAALIATNILSVVWGYNAETRRRNTSLFPADIKGACDGFQKITEADQKFLDLVATKIVPAAQAAGYDEGKIALANDLHAVQHDLTAASLNRVCRGYP